MAEGGRLRVRAKVAEIAGVAPADLRPEMSLTGDLPFDSLQLYELVAALEDEFGLGEIDEAELARIETVGDVEARVLELLAAEVEG
ncbi:MAG TPA: acyl carrier protein [Solirubrobacterales bacterium]|nr:acyl carrier protein [Solirubrobacterales bacterium]